jgi:RNA polymerase sigma-70 factor (ECF subfamily)
MSRIGTTDRTKEAFQELVARELPGLYSLARRLVRDGAEDLVQEALLQGYRAFGTLKEEAAGGRWLKTILVNVFRDQLRKRSRSLEEVAAGNLEDFSLYRTLIDEDPFPYSDSLHTDFLDAFGREELREVLLRMPEIYRAPLVLRYMDGFSTKEIARLLDAPLGTILARLHRGRRLFERTMWAYAEEARLFTMGDDDG